MLAIFKSNIFSRENKVKNSQKNFEAGVNLIKSGEDGPPLYANPFQVEKFVVLEGKLEVFKENKWYSISAGGTITIRNNTLHSFRSRDASDCYFEYILISTGDYKKSLLSNFSMGEGS